MLFYLYEDFLPSVSSVLYFGKHSRLILCFSYLLYCFLFLLYTQFYLRREMFTTEYCSMNDSFVPYSHFSCFFLFTIIFHTFPLMLPWNLNLKKQEDNIV